MIHTIKYGLAFLLLQGCVLFAQDTDDANKPSAPAIIRPLPKVDLRAICTIPEVMGNEAMKKSFTGVYQLNLSNNYRIVKNFFTGIALNHGLFEVIPSKIPGINTNMKLYGGGLQMGYDFQVAPKTFISLSVCGGKNYTEFMNVYNNKQPRRSSYNYQSNFFETELNIYFHVEANFAMGVNFSYNIISHNFDPTFVHFQEFRGYHKGDEVGVTHYLNFGFNFYFGFKKKKGQ